jgi:hypothetical protein
MKKADADKLGRLAPLARYAQKAMKPMPGQAGRGAMARRRMSSVREADHNGHHIVIRTHYEISVDGKKLAAPFAVDDDGKVICHALPNYTSASAVELVKQIVDHYPDEFPVVRRKRGGSHDGHTPRHSRRRKRT